MPKRSLTTFERLNAAAQVIDLLLERFCRRPTARLGNLTHHRAQTRAPHHDSLSLEHINRLCCGRGCHSVLVGKSANAREAAAWDVHPVGYRSAQPISELNVARSGVGHVEIHAPSIRPSTPSTPTLRTDCRMCSSCTSTSDTATQEDPLKNDPRRADLLLIEAEWPVIEAELEVVAAECRLAGSPGDQLAIRAHRRAVRSLLAVLAESIPNPNPLASGDRPDAA